MKEIFKQYLANKGILVADIPTTPEEAFYTTYALANMFNVSITEGADLASKGMIEQLENVIGVYVPQAFYKGFPATVKKLSKDELLFDQLFHYAVTYGIGNFEGKGGHSLFEEDFKRSAFKEKTAVKKFVIITEEKAVQVIEECVEDLLCSTRPVSKSQYEVILNYCKDYNYKVSACACGDTIIDLLIDTEEVYLANLLRLSDVVKFVEYINFRQYKNTNVKKLNFSNSTRKFVTKVLDIILAGNNCNVIDCYEKKAKWSGILHHIHYKPKNDFAVEFVNAMRGSENKSVYSDFEKAMSENKIMDAVDILKKGKGSSALLRNVNYILSRCKTKEEISYVIENTQTENPIVLIQLLISYANYRANAARTFKFTKFNLMRVHTETEEEQKKRASSIPNSVIKMLKSKISEMLIEIYKGTIDTVYIDTDMKKIALPLQETTAMGGYGMLPKGSRIPVERGKKIRCFTYWEKVNDIDLSVVGIDDKGSRKEYSWRTMYKEQSDGISFSGDQVRGYEGGSEFFDVIPTAYRRKNPGVKYLIFSNNVYSASTFDKCVCKAGYMLRDVKDSGEIFEPKTVATSYTINAESTFAYLFALDLVKNEIVWLNLSRDSEVHVAGTTPFDFLLDYFNMTDVINVYDLFEMLATKVVKKPELADVVVTDKDVEVKEGAEVIRSYDFERILAYMNKK